MARDIQAKLQAGETLDEDDIQYAVDRGIELPEEYGAAVKQYEYDAAANFGRPPFPVADGGSAPGPSMGPGLFLTEDQLSELKVDVLEEIADVVGVELSGNKPDKVAQLSGGTSVEAPNDEDEPEA